MTGAPHDDIRNEFQALVQSARAFLEMHHDAGATGLPQAAPATELSPSAVGYENEEAAPEVSAPMTEPEGRAAPASVDPLRLLSIEPPVRSSKSAMVSSISFSGSIPDTADGRLVRLRVLASEISTCKRCILHETRTQTVFSRGNPQADLCFIGEGPGADEDTQGVPFVGKAGQLLDRMINAMGFARDDVYICNIIKCRPPKNRKPEPEEMSSCMPYLTEQLALMDPKVIVALGATAVEGLLGTRMGITRLRGQWKLYRASIPVMPTYHPAYLLRTPAAKREVWTDLQAVLDRLGRGIPKRVL